MTAVRNRQLVGPEERLHPSGLPLLMLLLPKFPIETVFIVINFLLLQSGLHYASQLADHNRRHNMSHLQWV